MDPGTKAPFRLLVRMAHVSQGCRQRRVGQSATGDLAVPSGGMGFGPGHLPHRAIFFGRPREWYGAAMAPTSKTSAAVPHFLPIPA